MSRHGGAIRACLGLLFLGSRDSTLKLIEKCEKYAKANKSSESKQKKSKELQTKQRQKKFKQVFYLRKGKPTKRKADAEKVNKQTRKTENHCNKNKVVKKF